MFVFDTDHLSLLQRPQSTEYVRLAERCSEHPPSVFFITIVSFHEQVNGWTKYVAKANQTERLVRGYTKLEGILDTFARAQVLPFSSAAADVYDDLQSQKTKVGAMDRRIASIAIANGMTLLTRNTVDFERVPGLQFADWTTNLT